MFDPAIEEDEYQDEMCGHIELGEAVSWLESKGYQVDVTHFVDMTDMFEL